LTIKVLIFDKLTFKDVDRITFHYKKHGQSYSGKADYIWLRVSGMTVGKNGDMGFSTYIIYFTVTNINFSLAKLLWQSYLK
jgi:hypothetical protein